MGATGDGWPAGVPAWHALAPPEALAAIGSDRTTGLTAVEVRARVARFGANVVAAKKQRSALAVALDQLRSPLIYLLFGAGGVALVFGHTSDAVVILVVVVLNAVIGAFQAGRARRSLESLRALSTHQARVVRDGHERLVAARELVPGDVVLIEAGDAVPADARLLVAAQLRVTESALTGESLPVDKAVAANAAECPLAERASMVFAGTQVAAGRARALIVATGAATQIGDIATLASTAVQPQTPLERRMARFGHYVIVAAAGVFVLVLAVGLLRGMQPAEIVMLGISQVVGMVPEGLPVAVTIALAVGVQRMARRRAVVRRLGAVETLGSTTVVCTDKTGTLTRNEMTVTVVVLADGRELAVTGVGYDPAGRFQAAGHDLDPSPADLQALLEACVLCNDARLEAPDAATPTWRPVGDPTEVALVTLAMKGGVQPASLRAHWPRHSELPFDPAARLMATAHASADGTRVVVKGAPESILDLCHAVRHEGVSVPLDAAQRGALLGTAAALAGRALRVLAVGTVDGGALDGEQPFSQLHGRVTFLGLLGQLDPPREEIEAAIARCWEAGIRPVMLTGDHKATGHAIALALGIARAGDEAVDGTELAAMSDAELDQRIGAIAVFARVQPAQKLRVVSAYQRRGDVVAMTGDGANDAPALAKADVGVAMGITGTEVAKGAADIVIVDDNFETIVAAVEEGRVAYRNIRKAVLLLFSTSAAEVSVLALALIFGYPLPFVAVQVLWNNLVTEGLITVNLIMEPAEGDEMQRPPIPVDESLLSRIVLTRMAVMVPAIVVSTLGWFVVRLSMGVPEDQVRTETFTLLAICEWFNVLSCRSETRSALTLAVFRNRWLVGGLVLGNLLQVAVVFWAPLNRVFHTVPLGFDIVIALGLVGSVVLWSEELRKLVVRRRRRSGSLSRPAGTARMAAGAGRQ